MELTVYLQQKFQSDFDGWHIPKLSTFLNQHMNEDAGLV